MSTTASVNGVSFSVPEDGDGDWASLTSYLSALAKAVSGILTFGNSSTPNSAATYYANPVYANAAMAGAELKLRAPAAGRLSHLYVKSSTAPSGGACVFTVLVNGSATGITCSLAAAATTAQDATHEVTVAAGDEISLKNVQAATTGTGVLVATLALTPS